MWKERDPFLLRRPQHTPLTGRRVTLELLNDNKQSEVELENFVLTMVRHHQHLFPEWHYNIFQCNSFRLAWHENCCYNSGFSCSAVDNHVCLLNTSSACDCDLMKTWKFDHVLLHRSTFNSIFITSCLLFLSRTYDKNRETWKAYWLMKVKHH